MKKPMKMKKDPAMKMKKATPTKMKKTMAKKYKSDAQRKAVHASKAESAAKMKKK